MQDKVFFDTNILIYCYSNDEEEKRIISNNLVKKYQNRFYISKQVINELSNILFKKMNLSYRNIEKVILEINDISCILDFKLSTQIKALEIKSKYLLQFYDALIVATALENRCNILYSEDMQDGLIIEDLLKIENPYKN